jgi:hypothetical protein
VGGGRVDALCVIVFGVGARLSGENKQRNNYVSNDERKRGTYYLEHTFVNGRVAAFDALRLSVTINNYSSSKEVW